MTAIQIEQYVRVVWRRGPVAVTGASGEVGTLLLRRLSQLPNEVRPVGREDESAFVAKSGRVMLLGRETQRLAPLYRNDVVEAILHAALDPEVPTWDVRTRRP